MTLELAPLAPPAPEERNGAALAVVVALVGRLADDEPSNEDDVGGGDEAMVSGAHCGPGRCCENCGCGGGKGSVDN